MRAAILLLILSAVLGTLLSSDRALAVSSHSSRGPGAGNDGCLKCHEGVEEMHPGFALSCVECHGGDPEATKKEAAHIASSVTTRNDERVAPLNQDLAYVRFINPMDLRVAEKVCGDCHGELVQHLMLSLHGTTAGHLSDGFFETGIEKGRDSTYAVFPTEAPRAKGAKGEGPQHAVSRLLQPPRIDSRDDPEELATHFPDLVRKECMQCHLWSQGRAVRGRVGFDGEYRGGGCAACHVPYRTDGLSESADRSANRVEPGHPKAHSMVTAPPTETCTSCHYGDASIGLHFRGLSQLPPGAPGGPDIDGTTDSLLHRSFFINDPAITPPDVHHASGMHCVDCHTLNGIMGDGRLLSKMEQATEISCEACHGTFEAPSTMTTEHGTRLKHLFERDGGIWMRSKVTGAEHRIKQVVDVLSVSHPDYNEDAVGAMNGSHANVACYTCHAGWNVNFLGFHFYRNEALTQLDLISGERTKGRVTTQEKVFTTWKSFYAGLDEKGRVAPYLTGFSTMGTVDGEDGTRILDQELPVTQNGLSGLTMIHHQLHSTRPTARTCVECHRASETWGMGSSNFRLGRQLAFAADRRGIEMLAFDRENPQLSASFAKFVLPDVVDIEIESSPTTGFASTIYVTERDRGVHAIDVRDPSQPKRLAFHMSVSPRGMALAGQHLYVADGIGGVKVFDVSKPGRLKRVATLPTLDAHEIEVRWPYAYVADGIGGLLVVDIRIPVAPRVIGGLETEGDGVVDLDVLFQYSRPTVTKEGLPSELRTPARRLVAACDISAGPILIDATEPAHLFVIESSNAKESSAESRGEGAAYLSVALRSHVDVASTQGGEKTVERDVMYFIERRPVGNDDFRTAVRINDVSNPEHQKRVGRGPAGNVGVMMEFGAWYNPPFLRPIVLVPGDRSIALVDVTSSSEPQAIGTINGIRDAHVIRAEEFPLDAMLDADGTRLKDVSHPVSRWLMKGEIEKLLRVPGEELGTVDFYAQESIAAASSARAAFAKADKDGSGLLVGRELSSAGMSAADEDKDGRVTLWELSRSERSDGRSVVLEEAESEVTPRAVDSSLARLLDVVDPSSFDKDGDGRLSEKEATTALFRALDLDGSKKLDVHELSRHPGGLRDLRYGDVRGAKAFAKIDRTGGGSVGLREFKLGADQWKELDENGDGFVQLDSKERGERVGGGGMPLEIEWPTRRLEETYDLPPNITEEKMLAAFDTNGDGRLTRPEMRKRSRLFEQLDRDNSSVVEPDEITRARARIATNGLRMLPDDFESRWDLDGNGKVKREELPPVAGTTLLRRLRK